MSLLNQFCAPRHWHQAAGPAAWGWL